MKEDSAYLFIIFTFQIITLGTLLVTMLSGLASFTKRGRPGIMKLCFIAFLSKWTYDVYWLVQQEVSEEPGAQGFDPYAILGVENNAPQREIKKTYRTLSLKWHPDKVDYETEKMTEKEVRARYTKLSKAYKTLTNKEAYNNWIKWGSPDGSRAEQAVGFAIPRWMREEKNRSYVLGGIFVSVCAIIISIVTYMNQNSHLCANGILKTSKINITDMVFAIFQENKRNVRARGPLNEDIIDMFETAVEVIELNEKWEKKLTFKDVVLWLISNQKQRAKFTNPEGGPIVDGKNPEQYVLELLPKLNEVSYEIVSDLAGLRNQEGEPALKFNKEAFVSALNKFTLLFEHFKAQNSGANAEKRTVVIKVECEEQAAKFSIGDLIHVQAKIERTGPAPDEAMERKLFIACISQISGRAVVQEFQQNKEIEEISFKTMSQKPGNESYRVLVFDGYGELSTSNAKRIFVVDDGNYHGYNADDLPEYMDAPGE